MAYEYAKQKEVTEVNEFCLAIIKKVQKIVRDYFTFDIRLIGSGEKRLVTINGNHFFDLDYNLIIQKDKKGLFNNPKAIKQLFIDVFDDVLEKQIEGYKRVRNSTSVITNKIQYGNKLFSFDIAIIVKADNDYYYKIVYDKVSNRYLWNQIKGSKDYLVRYEYIKKNGMFNDFKERYLELKNMHLKRNDEVKSFSIFLETLNEFEQYGR